MKANVYERVTNTIISQLEQGVRPWYQPWSAGHAEGRIVQPLRANGIAYRGINVLMLWGAAVEQGFTAPHWFTYCQAQAMGGQVRGGQKGSLVVYADTLKRTGTDETTGEETERAIPFMKAYTVFNAAQIDDLPLQYNAPSNPILEPAQRIERADDFFAATGAIIGHGGGRAYYSEAEDRVQMPPFEAFNEPAAYYAVLAHEMTHWTKGPGRIEREFGRKRFGDAGYAMEELVAEMGAAFLSAALDLTPEPRPEHASYLDVWLTVLKQDKRAIFSAASHAQRAADYLYNLAGSAEAVAA